MNVARSLYAPSYRVLLTLNLSAWASFNDFSDMIASHSFLRACFSIGEMMSSELMSDIAVLASSADVLALSAEARASLALFLASMATASSVYLLDLTQSDAT